MIARNCPDCRGHGEVITYLRYGRPSAVENFIRCERCAGTGKADPCATPNCQSVAEQDSLYCINCQDEAANQPTKENHDQE